MFKAYGSGSRAHAGSECQRYHVHGDENTRITWGLYWGSAFMSTPDLGMTRCIGYRFRKLSRQIHLLGLLGNKGIDSTGSIFPYSLLTVALRIKPTNTSVLLKEGSEQRLQSLLKGPL